MFFGGKHCFPQPHRVSFMSSLNNLEYSGSLSDYPLAELLVEVLDAGLDGSVRLSAHNSKAIIYFRDGQVRYAVSNQRRHRLFELLLNAQLVTKRELIDVPEFTNDIVLATALRESGKLADSTVATILARQVESILIDGLKWKDGNWTLSPLVRVKNDLTVEIDTRMIMMKHARDIAKDAIIRRFKSFKELFGRNQAVSPQTNLWPQEAFVLSRFENEMVRIEDINRLTGMPDADNLKCLYALWLGGFLTRTGYNSAISTRRIADMRSAKLELRREAKAVPDPVAEAKPEPVVETKPEAAPEPKPKREISLESYLRQVEHSETHYETLNIPLESDTARIKKAYFDLAKRFHPDLFHKQTTPEQLRRIQNAFTQIAHAYETLRNEETRLRYDYRLKSIMAELQRQGKGGVRSEQQTSHKQLREASEIFDHGFSLLLDEDYEAALPYLTRAVAMAPDVGRYRAYYGKVLSVDRTQKFKAETEFQAAIKLEPENPTFRLLLVEFFMDYNLFKRAEGELNRLLEIAPDNYEARAMLDSLLQKS